MHTARDGLLPHEISLDPHSAEDHDSGELGCSRRVEDEIDLVRRCMAVEHAEQHLILARERRGESTAGEPACQPRSNMLGAAAVSPRR